VEHRYHFNIFNTTINFQLHKFDNIFDKRTMKLLTLGSTFIYLIKMINIYVYKVTGDQVKSGI
jgi:hypothetical protein